MNPENSDVRKQYAIYKIDSKFIYHSAVKKDSGGFDGFELDIAALKTKLAEAKKSVCVGINDKREKSKIADIDFEIKTSDCIAFNQICEQRELKKKEEAEISQNKKAGKNNEALTTLKEYIVLVEFSEYSHSSKSKYEYQLDNAIIKMLDLNNEKLQIYEKHSSFNKKDKGKYIFEKGFKIKFTENGDPIHFVRFEKSQSMAKNCVMAFIRQDISEAIKERVTLGLEGKIKEAVISKWHAYKGLVLSSAMGIDLTLDKDKVIVVRDGHISENKSAISATKKEVHLDKNGEKHEYILTNNKRPIPKPGNCMRMARRPRRAGLENPRKIKLAAHRGHYAIRQRFWNTSKVIPIEPNQFDGAGLISKEYAEIIENILIESKKSNDVMTSFQFRMPFCKGMLHKVDFKTFFREELRIEKIEDIWGHPHEVDKIEIILTESQFKAKEWFDEVYGEKSAWEKYWGNFKNNKHKFYIVQYNKTDECQGLSDILSYQVLHTLNIDETNFEKLLDTSMETYEKLKNDYEAQLINFGLVEGKNIRNETDEGNPKDDGENQSDENDDYIYNHENKTGHILYAAAIEQNPRFIREAKIKSVVANTASSFLLNLRKGRFIVKGKTRFLSPDLLRLLYHIADPNNKDKKIQEKKKNEKFIGKGFFYAPKVKLENRDKNDLSITRNPHISRNEHVVAKLWFPNKEGNVHKYLKHLDGVCMVNPADCFAERLAGADYDGDIVKIIDNEIFVEAAKPAKSLPIIKIPNLGKSKMEINENNEWTTVKNTFSSNVGKYTNYAFNIAAEAYNNNLPNETKESAQKNLNLMTILIGLEIDSAKTGVKPYIPSEIINDNENFLIMKYYIEKHGYYYKSKTKIDDDECNLNKLQNIIDKKLETIKKPRTQTLKLDQLLDGKKLKNVKFTAEQKNMMTALIIAYSELTSEYYNESDPHYKPSGYIMDTLMRQEKLCVLDKNDIFDICDEIFSNLSMHKLFQLLKKQRDDLWAFTDRKDRKNTLEKLFEHYGIKIDPEWLAMLSDFNFSGYDLLSYFIQLQIDIRKEKFDTNKSKSIDILGKNANEAYKILETEFGNKTLMQEFANKVYATINKESDKKDLDNLKNILKKDSGDPDDPDQDILQEKKSIVVDMMECGENTEIYKILTSNIEYLYSPFYFAASWILAEYHLKEEEEYRYKLFENEINTIKEIADLKNFGETTKNLESTSADEKKENEKVFGAFVQMYKKQLKETAEKESVLKISKINEAFCEILLDDILGNDKQLLIGSFIDRDMSQIISRYNSNNQLFWLCAAQTAIEKGYIKEYSPSYDFPELKEGGEYDYKYQSYKTSKIEFGKSKEASAND